MKLRVDTSGLEFRVAKPPEPVKEYGTEKVKEDGGRPLFSVKVFALGDGDAEVLAVKVAGAPEGLVAFQPVELHELTAQPWSMGDKSGVAFRASAIVPTTERARNGQGV